MDDVGIALTGLALLNGSSLFCGESCAWVVRGMNGNILISFLEQDSKIPQNSK
ncbi:MAG TPA: hypothetical protein VIP56_10225 [Nitrososphaeraceae archaeon]